MTDPHLKLVAKLEELDAYTHTVLHQFPKLERHLLCAEMRTAMNKACRLAVMSWIAHASHAESYGLRRKLLGSIPFVRD